MPDNVKTVEKFWKLFAAATYELAGDLMAEDAKTPSAGTSEFFENKYNFIKANREYPGEHIITVENIVSSDDMVVTAVKVGSVFEQGAAPDYFYAASFFGFRDGLISEITEYWAGSEEPPAWRIEKKLAKRVKL
jgi:hypothetical protein